MTFVLSLQTSGSIWVVSDRRLSATNQKPKDDAVKVAALETVDGQAILSYAGLGATALGNQPSQWISNVLRGRSLPLEGSLRIIADAMKREFLPHFSQVRNVRQRQHGFLVSAFAEGQHRVYTIELAGSRDGYYFRNARHIMGGAAAPLQITLPIVAAGSGSLHIATLRHRLRPLISLVSAYNETRISPSAVCDRLAELCFQVHEMTSDGSVGPRCIIVWRNAKASAHKGGGGQASYNGLVREAVSPAVPFISGGMDVVAVSSLALQVLAPRMQQWQAEPRSGDGVEARVFDSAELDRRLKKLPYKPDEKLR